MKKMRLTTVVSLVSLWIGMSVSAQALSQTYPNRPITFVVPASTGSSMDIMARQIGPVLTKRLGQAVVVENREGASGNIGVMRVVKAAADGYTVLVGANITHVPYKGIAGAVTGLMSGQIQAMFTTVHSVLPQVQAGTLRILSIASDKRVPWFPDVPTMAEEGIVGVDSDGWVGLFVPARTPQDVIKRLSEETLSIIAQPELRETVLKQGVIVDPAGPEELAALLKRDLAKWQRVVARGNIKGE